MFFTFFFFGSALIMFAFFLTSIVREARQAVLIGIFFFIIGLLFETFVFSSAFLGYIWWAPNLIDSTGWLVLMFIPFFNFGHMFLDITTYTTGRLDTLTQTYIPGPGFAWSNLYEQIPKNLMPSYDGQTPDLPVPVQAWYFLIMNTFVYMILAWYLDNVIPDMFGASKPLYFFLLPEYWGFKTRHVETKRDEWLVKNVAASKEDNAEEDDDVATERQEAKNPGSWPAVKVVNLRKVYSSLSLCRGSDVKVAVRNSCITFEQGQLFALLGQNGAGKSTTISMLSGLTPATGGDALIFGLSVQTQMSEIRSQMGICPQHDILFDDLTAREHIQLYAGLKGVTPAQMSDLITQRLQAVRLDTVADVRAGTYSGGMKRRLSLVISTIGDPKIVFMDEPTTGMDPVNRRHVWSFVEKFKKDRVIVLTTHSMEEADVVRVFTTPMRSFFIIVSHM